MALDIIVEYFMDVKLLTPVCIYSRHYIWAMTFLGSGYAGYLTVPVLLTKRLDM